LAPDKLIFDKYEVIRRLAIGGMGEIFLARQSGVPGFERLVVLKSLLPDLAEQKDFVDMFLDEARVAATLNHPNIVSIYEVGLSGGTYFIAMEYIEGENLARILQAVVEANERIPYGITAQIIHDAALGLLHAHQATDTRGNPIHVVHRDVSPQNIMVRVDGVTRVVDFGIARAANRASRTATGMVKGKLRYMAPEQIEGKPLDHRCDQFALGVVLWETLTCQRLFGGPSDFETMRRLVHEPIPAPHTIVDDVPPELEKIVLRMLQKDIEARFPSCSEIVDGLRAYLAGNTEAGPKSVAALVRQKVGDQIKERTQEIRSVGDDFIIDLRSEEDPATRRQRPRRPRDSRFSVTLSAIVALALLVTGLYLVTHPSISQPAEVQSAPAAPARLALTSTPTQSQVTIDGKDVGPAPVSTELPATDAPLKVVVSKPGFLPQTLEIVPRPGALIDRHVTLEPIRKKRTRSHTTRAEPQPPGAAVPGELTLNTVPWTLVTVDGRRLGTTPLSKIKLPAGEHELLLENKSSRIVERRRIVIQSGKLTKVDLILGKK